MSPIDIQLQVTGGDAARAAFRNLANDAEDFGKSASTAANKVDEVSTATDKVDGGGFDDAAASAKAFAATVETAEEKLENLNRKAENIRNIGAGIAAAGAGGIMLSNSWAQAASDVSEAENLIKESFGSANTAVTEWGNNLEATLGISSVEARKAAATFNLMFNSMNMGADKSMELSKGLTLLANDMASFYNLSPEEAFEKLRAGITGEAEPLKALGILIDEETTKQYAYANGIAASGAQLTNQEKVLARYGIIMESTSKAQGDLARTQDSAANTTRRAEVAYKNATVALGSGSMEAKKQIDNMGVSLLGIVGHNEKIAATSGWLATWGSYLAAGVGSMVAFGAQLVILVNGIIAFRAAKLAQAAAQSTAAAAAVTEAGAVTLAGNASLIAGAKAGIAAIGFSTLAATIGLAALALAGFAVAAIGSKDASTMSDERLKEKWGPLGSFWSWASGSSQGNSETGDNMDGGMSQPDAAPSLPSAALPAGMAVPGAAAGGGSAGVDTPSASKLENAAKKAKAEQERNYKKMIDGQIADADRNADIAINALNQRTETEAAALAATKGEDDKKNASIDRAITQLKARADLKAAEIRAAAVAAGDEKQADAMMAMARDTFKGQMARADIAYGAASGKGGEAKDKTLSQVLRSMNRAPVRNLTGDAAGTNGMTWSGFGGGMSAPGGALAGLATSAVGGGRKALQAAVRSVTTTSDAIEVVFERIVIPTGGQNNAQFEGY